MRPLIIFYDDIFDEVYYLNNTNNIKDTSIIYCMKLNEFITQFKFSEEVIQKWYILKHPDFQQKIYLELINNIDNHQLKFINISNPNLSNKSFGWLKVLIIRIVNEWLDYNLMSINNPWYIDIDKYAKNEVIYSCKKKLQLLNGGYDENRKHLGLWILVLWVQIPLKPLQWTWKIKLSTLIMKNTKKLVFFLYLFFKKLNKKFNIL